MIAEDRDKSRQRRKTVNAIRELRVGNTHGRYLDGVVLDWVDEGDALDRFTPLQLDTFHAVWDILSPPTIKVANTPASNKRPTESGHLGRKEALTTFPMGTKVVCQYRGGYELFVNRTRQVCAFLLPWGRVRFPENDWEELTP